MRTGNGKIMMERGVRFAVWAQSRHTPLTWQAIALRWEVSRATAYRYLVAYQDAVGMVA